MLNRGFFPVDGDYDEFPSFRRQCEAQQARRRHAEMEYYHHMKKEEEERQRRQVATRRRQQEKEEQEYIRMKQAEMRRCRQQKAEQQRKKAERRRRQQQKEEEDFMRKWQQEEVRLRKEKEQQQRRRQEAEEEYAEMLRRREEGERMRLRRQQQQTEAPQWQIVRGPDGRLYRIPVDKDESLEPKAPRSEQDRIEHHRERQQPSIRRLNSSTGEVDDTMSVSTEHEPILEKRTKKNKSRRRKRVTILVEDASDSEMEDDELDSPFRNRHPGPGETWLEPVGAFA